MNILFSTVHSLFSKTAWISIYSAGLIQPVIQKTGVWFRMMLMVKFHLGLNSQY